MFVEESSSTQNGIEPKQFAQDKNLRGVDPETADLQQEVVNGLD